MKTKLLRRLRRRAYLAIGMTARVFSCREMEYRVGSRKEILRENYHHLDKFYNYSQALHSLYRQRREYIGQLLRDIRLDRAHRQLKKLNRKYRRL